MTTKPQPAPAYPHLTELPDPPPLPDGMKQRPHIARIDQVLRSHYRRQPHALVSGEGYLCFEARDARSSPRPDCVVALDLPFPAQLIEEANGYVISEVGQPPDFVLEVASPSTGQHDYTSKRNIYARLDVQEYWRFDPSGGQWHNAPLAGDILENGVYRPLPVVEDADGLIRGYSPSLGLELHSENRLLRFWDPAEQEYLPDLIEALEALAAAEARAGQAEARAEQAEARAEQAEEEVRRLRTELNRRQSPEQTPPTG